MDTAEFRPVIEVGRILDHKTADHTQRISSSYHGALAQYNAVKRCQLLHHTKNRAAKPKITYRCLH